MLTRMVRVPLSPEQVKAGQRLGTLIRAARAGRDPETIARRAGISPETLRKIEVGRMPSPSFGTVIGLCGALGLPLQEAVDAWHGPDDQQMAI
jgi:transcriptional regulator with XRE-family HTH domain